MTNNKTGLEKFVEWAEKLTWGHYDFLTKARTLLDQERARHTADQSAEPVESLVVLACKKNSWIAFAGQTMGGKYRINIETMHVPLAGDSCFMEEVYAEAESKARAYLLSLTDKGGK